KMTISRGILHILAVLSLTLLIFISAQDGAVSNEIAMPGQPLYYMMADSGRLVAANDSLKRSHRSFLKWWDNLFQLNTCCNHNNVVHPPAEVASTIVSTHCNDMQLQDLDPFKQIKLLKKLPDLFSSSNSCVHCGGGCGHAQVPQNNYATPLIPTNGTEGYGELDDGEYLKPNSESNGPGDGNTVYAQPLSSDSYGIPPASTYDAVVYDAKTPSIANYDPPVPYSTGYDSPAPPTFVKSNSVPVQHLFGGAQQPQIVYQPIIYVSTPQQSFGSQTSSIPLSSIYKAPLPAMQPPSSETWDGTYAPLTPSFATPPCETPIRLTLIDQPYRVAPELFSEYNYRLELSSQN
ncbi:hypothetical protein KR009_002016, partial [Drosophila setifemur]